MMNPTSPERARLDSRIIGQTLMRLATPRLIVRALVLAVAIVIWLIVSSTLLDVGRSLSFDSLHSLGQQTVDLLTRLNPYFWWVVVAIWSLIVFFIARSWLYSDMAAARTRVVDANTLASLRASLSDEAVEVLRWVWGDRDDPFTIGDLQRARRELRGNRVGKIALVREQSAILDQARASSAAPVSGTVRSHNEPTIGGPIR